MYVCPGALHVSRITARMDGGGFGRESDDCLFTLFQHPVRPSAWPATEASRRFQASRITARMEGGGFGRAAALRVLRVLFISSSRADLRAAFEALDQV